MRRLLLNALGTAHTTTSPTSESGYLSCRAQPRHLELFSDRINPLKRQHRLQRVRSSDADFYSSALRTLTQVRMGPYLSVEPLCCSVCLPARKRVRCRQQIMNGVRLHYVCVCASPKIFASETAQPTTCNVHRSQESIQTPTTSRRNAVKNA